MTTFTRSDELQGAEFVDADLRGARFVGSDLSGVVMRGVEVQGAEIDAPWLFDGGSSCASTASTWSPSSRPSSTAASPAAPTGAPTDPDGLRAAWAALERTWAATLERVAAMPAGTVDVSVDGEWSFAQTLRHLVLATDMWLGRAVLEVEQPFHPLGLRDAGTRATATTCRSSPPAHRRTTTCSRPGPAGSRWCATSSPPSPRRSWRRRAGTRTTPPTRRPSLSCLHVILEEEWEHHRYAVRDLDAIEARRGQ